MLLASSACTADLGSVGMVARGVEEVCHAEMADVDPVQSEEGGRGEAVKRTDYEIPDSVMDALTDEAESYGMRGDIEVADYDPADCDEEDATGVLFAWVVNRYPSGGWADQLRPLTAEESALVLRATVDRLVEEHERVRPLLRIAHAIKDAVRSGVL